MREKGLQPAHLISIAKNSLSRCTAYLSAAGKPDKASSLRYPLQMLADLKRVAVMNALNLTKAEKTLTSLASDKKGNSQNAKEDKQEDGKQNSKQLRLALDLTSSRHFPVLSVATGKRTWETKDANKDGKDNGKDAEGKQEGEEQKNNYK